MTTKTEKQAAVLRVNHLERLADRVTSLTRVARSGEDVKIRNTSDADEDWERESWLVCISVFPSGWTSNTILVSFASSLRDSMPP